ncbi:unnamed protein product [Protopolystoma xenopodis]|uniref:V-type proton ATPase subunit G n=1 Tax=Protopolystoma xenopodis TaxID=117903 RepID=A0A448WQV9_9PLAT|nr:unnamed protein product [Protopolystoma xenopodis]
MASASQLDGVAQLNVAKTAATAKIEEARARRAKRLKEAKDEARVEVDTYKEERERQLKKAEELVRFVFVYFSKADIALKSVGESWFSTDVDKVEKLFNTNKESALTLLLHKVLNVEPKIHQNLVNSA